MKKCYPVSFEAAPGYNIRRCLYTDESDPLVWDTEITSNTPLVPLFVFPMIRLLTLVALYLLSVSQTIVASPCIAFDSNWNLFAFGLNGKDYNAGTQDKWSGSKSCICDPCRLTPYTRPRQ
jgi:hypothetical protein